VVGEGGQLVGGDLFWRGVDEELEFVASIGDRRSGPVASTI
jgi:hypothetical protein